MNLHRWEDIHVGLAYSFTHTFTAEQARQFAALSGDVNPLHADEDYAAGAGYSSPVLFGLMVSSLYSQLAGVWLPGKYALLQGIDVDFSSPVFAGEELTCTGQVAYMTEAYKRFEIKASIRKADRKLVSKATIRVGFHGE